MTNTPKWTDQDIKMKALGHVKDVVGYEGLYMVDAYGNVYSIPRNTAIFRIVKPFRKANHYLRLTLSKNGVKKCCYIHRIVAEAFIPNPSNKPQVNHKDGVKHNNHVDNLEWCTPSENQRHAFRSGLSVAPWKGRFGKDNFKSKPVLQVYKNGGICRKWENAEEAGRNGYDPSKIRQVCIGNRFTHKKYKWQYE